MGLIANDSTPALVETGITDTLMGQIIETTTDHTAITGGVFCKCGSFMF